MEIRTSNFDFEILEEYFHYRLMVRLIQSVKRTLLIILGSKRFTLDVFHTIKVEAEAIMNSRSLTNVSDSLENNELLTPNHLLLQRQYNSLPTGVFPSTKPASMKSWKNVQQFLNQIWRKLLWEYLPTLAKKPKWTESNGSSLKANDVVSVLKKFTARGIWLLGRAEEMFPERDGNNRVVKVKTV